MAFFSLDCEPISIRVAIHRHPISRAKLQSYHWHRSLHVSTTQAIIATGDVDRGLRRERRKV